MAYEIIFLKVWVLEMSLGYPMAETRAYSLHGASSTHKPYQIIGLIGEAPSLASSRYGMVYPARTGEASSPFPGGYRLCLSGGLAIRRQAGRLSSYPSAVRGSCALYDQLAGGILGLLQTNGRKQDFILGRMKAAKAPALHSCKSNLQKQTIPCIQLVGLVFWLCGFSLSA